MLFKSKFFRVICVFCLVFSLSSMSLADTIRLKDGSIIKGKIVNFTGGKFTVVIGDGARQRQMNFYADEVESIEFDAMTTMPAADNKPPIQLPVKSNTSTYNTNTSKPVGDTTVITVGDTNKNNNPQTTSPKTSTTSGTTQPSNTNPTTSNPSNTSATSSATNPTGNNPRLASQPIKLSVKVLADNTANGWTNSGWVVKKGQKIRISGSGNVSLGGGNFSTPAGLSSLSDKDKLMAKEATGALIAVIGDDNNDFILIGSSREFVAARDGALFLGLNEGNLNDNSGAFDVTVEIDTNN